MGNRKGGSPELIVAVMAVVIGVCTMFVYIYQARIMSKQLHATSWPYLEVIFSTSSEEFVVKVKNKGTGPAIVKKAFITLDGAVFADSKKNLDSITYLLTGSRGILNGYTNIIQRVMSPQEEINFIEVSDTSSVKLVMNALRSHNIQLEICYCSVFDECWMVARGRVETCDDCRCD